MVETRRFLWKAFGKKMRRQLVPNAPFLGQAFAKAIAEQYSTESVRQSAG